MDHMKQQDMNFLSLPIFTILVLFIWHSDD